MPVKSDTVLPTARQRCNISLKGVVSPAGAMTRRWAPQTRYTLWRNTARINKQKRLNELSCSRNLTPQLMHLLHPNAGYIISRKEIRAGRFSAYWVRRFGNYILSTKLFVR